MEEVEFPSDRFRRISKDGGRVLWSVEEVDNAIGNHFHLGRNERVDERVADLWDAAFYIILVREIWEGWLVDWKRRLADGWNVPIDQYVPACLFDYFSEALELLLYAGAIRTRYEDDSMEQILSRLPPTSVESQNFDSKDYFNFYCGKVAELVPLQAQMVRLQKHFECNPRAFLSFEIVRLGVRMYGNYPGTFLDIYVGYDPKEDDFAVGYDFGTDFECVRSRMQTLFTAMNEAKNGHEYLGAQEAVQLQWQELESALRQLLTAADSAQSTRVGQGPDTVEDWQQLASLLDFKNTAPTIFEMIKLASQWNDLRKSKVNFRADFKEVIDGNRAVQSDEQNRADVKSDFRWRPALLEGYVIAMLKQIPNPNERSAVAHIAAMSGYPPPARGTLRKTYSWQNRSKQFAKPRTINESQSNVLTSMLADKQISHQEVVQTILDLEEKLGEKLSSDERDAVVWTLQQCGGGPKEKEVELGDLSEGFLASRRLKKGS